MVVSINLQQNMILKKHIILFLETYRGVRSVSGVNRQFVRQWKELCADALQELQHVAAIVVSAPHGSAKECVSRKQSLFAVIFEEIAYSSGSVTGCPNGAAMDGLEFVILQRRVRFERNAGVLHAYQFEQLAHLVGVEESVFGGENRNEPVGLVDEARSKSMVEMSVREQVRYEREFVGRDVVLNTAFLLVIEGAAVDDDCAFVRETHDVGVLLERIVRVDSDSHVLRPLTFDL